MQGYGRQPYIHIPSVIWSTAVTTAWSHVHQKWQAGQASKATYETALEVNSTRQTIAYFKELYVNAPSGRFHRLTRYRNALLRPNPVDE